MKKKYIFIVASLVLAILCIFLLFSPSTHQEHPVVTINNIPIPEDEFRLQMNKNIAATHNHFFLQWGVNNHHNFWETTYGYQTPLEYIKDKTLEELVDVKVKQKLAVEIGLSPEFTFEDLSTWWKQDNIDRKTKQAEGKAVYGPVENTLEMYHQYFFSNLFIKLQSELNEVSFTPSDDDLRSYFNRNKKELFQYTPEVEVEYLEFPYKSISEKKIAFEEALTAREKIQNGTSIKELRSDSREVFFGHQVYSDEDKIIGEDNPDQQLKKLAFRLNVGDVEVVDGRENYSVYLMHCISRATDTTYSFDEVKNDVVWHYQQEKYTILIDSLKRNANIEINEPLYKSIKVI
ncbi:MAG: peptidylprolyl isomerase [Cyclobacteriaceae bacterium]